MNFVNNTNFVSSKFSRKESPQDVNTSTKKKKSVESFIIRNYRQLNPIIFQLSYKHEITEHANAWEDMFF